MARIPKWAIPQDWTENDGWSTVIFCCPSSVEWRAIVRGLIDSLTYGRQWSEDTGSIIGVLEVARRINGSLSMDCGADIARIADAVEGIKANTDEALEYVDSQFISFSEFLNVLQLAGLEELQPWIDALGELVEIFGYLPDFNLQMPLGNILEALGTFFFRRDIKAKMDDLILMTEANAVGQFGPSIGIVLNELLEHVPGGSIADTVLGAVDETILGFSDDLITALTGNYVTNRLDDIRNALNGGSILPGDNVVKQLKNLKDQVALLELAVTVNSTGGGSCGCFEVGPEDDAPAAEIEPGTGDPPETHEDWDEYSQDKCNYANKIVDEIIALLALGVTLQAVPGLVAVGSIVAAVALIVSGPASIFTLLGVIVVVGSTALIAYSALAYLMINYPSDLTQLRDDLDADKANIICQLYQQTTPGGARALLLEWLLTTAEEISIDTQFLNHVDDFGGALINNKLINFMIDAYPPLDESYIGDVDCSACGGSSPCSFQFATAGEPPVSLGEGNFRYDGLEFVLTSVELSAGVHTINFNIPDLCAECDPPINWCVRFTATTITTGLAANWTREVFCVTAACAGLNESDYSDQFPALDTDFSIASAQFANPAPFTITMRITGQLPPCSASPLAEGC